MRRFISCFVGACFVAVLVAGTAPGKNGQGVMCVLQAKLAAKNETTGSTSIAKGHTQIKVRNDGTIGFKTQILNRDHETFVAGHIHQAPAGVAGAVVVPFNQAGDGHVDCAVQFWTVELLRINVPPQLATAPPWPA